LKILVADDSRTNLALISDSLKKLGHEVLPAKSGEEAIKIFANTRPDLVLLDVVMDGIDGFECAKKIRQISADDWIPIIFISASVDDESISKGINAGGDDYLTKPFSHMTLAAKIKAMQRISDMRQKLYETTQVLHTLSTTDSLTGAFNRFQFDSIIQEKLSYAKAFDTMFAILFLDLDHFKNINDTLGHQAGDQLLKNVVTRLKAVLSGNDFIARMGGDEFAIILDRIDSEDVAHDTAKKIIASLSDSHDLYGTNVVVGCSIGMCIFPKDGDSHEKLMRNADTAMYYAKSLGRNNYQSFNPKLLVIKDK
jgi:two-component system cell cycle response regulator